MKKIYLFIIATSFIFCSNEGGNETIEDRFNIWTGTVKTFTKASNSNADEKVNQDRITANVWITRNNEGGEIYNAVLESSAEKNISPLKTKWAIGEISNIENLTFKSFRSAIGSPKLVVGKKLVMYLEDEDAYVNVEFLSWDEGRTGGFSYKRATFK